MNRLKQNKLFCREDIGYEILLQMDDALNMYVFSSPEGAKNTEEKVSIRKMDFSSIETSVNIAFVSNRKGSCLDIRQKKKTLCYIIPVNLPRLFFVNDIRSRLIPTKSFEKTQRKIVKKSNGGFDAMEDMGWGDPSHMLKYAPERQTDSVLYLLFILNGAIKRRYDDKMELLWIQMKNDAFR